jgi:hypothetical protein
MGENTFFIGLTMAGAISAGAYTGGVLDVLFEALDRHNARYRAGKDAEWQGEFANHPRHKVALRVISGTSAGGVSAGLAVAGLVGARSDGNAPDGLQIGARGDGTFTSRSGYRYEYKYILRPLHHVWVEALDLYRNDGGGEEGFLTTGDLRDRPVESALNTQHIDGAAKAALTGIAWNGKPYSFLTEDLDLFLTTTNLQGIPYEVGFTAGTQDARHTHAMSQHSIVRHFRVSGLGEVEHGSPWLEAWHDTGVALPLSAGAQVDFETPGTPWARFKSAALATGAFPVGLAARVIDAEASDFGTPREDGAITGGAWPINLKPGLAPDTRPKPRLVLDGVEAQFGHTVHYVAVDGGVANNEPFELARYTLRRLCETDGEIQPGDKFLESNPRDAETADCAVLMIDPFPEGPSYTALTFYEAGLLAGVVPAVRNLLPALINQARFKPGELIEATDARVFSRYLLSPSRRERDDGGPAKLGAAAIASGSFGGFGGFFDRAFRAHDYMLGQRNAQSFLKRYFTLRSDNPLLDLPDERRASREMVRVIEAGDDFYKTDLPLPAWPRISQAQLDPILDHADDRISTLGGKILRDMKLSWFLRSILGSVWSWDVFGGAGKKIGHMLRAKVMHELIRRDQHENFKELTPGRPFQLWQRAVLIALAGAGNNPVPLALPADKRRARAAGGAEPSDLMSTVENPGITAEHLRGFLDSPEMSDRVWRAPSADGKDVAYTLMALRPDYAWTHNVKAVSDRVWGWFGR